jgi:hypothetical protein
VVEVKARNAALAVSLEAPGAAGRFEDNFFDLLPGERRSVRFWSAGRCGAGIGKALAKRLIVRTVYSAREIV